MSGTYFPFNGASPGSNTGSPAPGSPSMGNHHSLYTGSTSRYSNQLSFGAKMAGQSISNGHLNTYGSQMGVQSSNLVSSAPINIASAVSVHHQKQLEFAQQSRLASSPHHHARVTTTSTRTALAALKAEATHSGSTSSLSSNSDLRASKTKQAPSPPEDQSDPSEWKTLDMGGMLMSNISKELFRYTFLTCLYLNHNNLGSISPDISRLRSLVTLNLSGNKLTSIPAELGLVVSLKELLLFDNQLTFLPPEFGQLYQLEMLGIEGNPMSNPIASMLQKEGTTAVITYLRDVCPVGPPPVEREWIVLEEDAYGHYDSLTVLCYNALCEKYATPQAYAYTPSWALAWDYRKDLLLQDILNYNADIVCLQEVEMGQFEDFFKEQLSQLGEYDGIFYPKSRARTMSDYDRRQVDGCATFFKSSKYSILDKQVLEFQQMAMSRQDLRQYDDVFNRLMIKDNIAVLSLLEHKETGNKLIVANAHLHWDPAYCDVKLIQTAMLMQETERLSAAWTKAFPSRGEQHSSPIPTLICGDFNSLPDSAVYTFLAENQVPPSHEDLKSYNYGPYSESGGLVHKLPLKSAYSHIESMDFTNFTPTFKGVIDYVWYTSNSLSVTGLLSHVDREYAAKCVGFPNPHHPSDHIPLVVSFKHKSVSQTARKVSFK